jgi:hypothetical protein
MDGEVGPADRFLDMARKISENAGNGFSGAFVVVPPSGDPIDLLYLAGATDAAVFWGTLDTMVKIAIGKIQDAERQGNRPGW